MQGALERLQFDMHRAEEEAADVRNALQKVHNFLTRSLGDWKENILSIRVSAVFLWSSPSPGGVRWISHRQRVC